MWFVPGSHNEGVRPHHPVTEGKHVLTCDVKKVFTSHFLLSSPVDHFRLKNKNIFKIFFFSPN